MTEPRRPLGHWPKLIRAQEHLGAVEAEIDFWREGDVCTAIGKFESDGVYVVRVEERIPPPIRLAILIGDLVGNLRAALDHQLFALLETYVPTKAGDPDLMVNFPCYESGTWVPRGGGSERPVAYAILDGLPDFVQTLIKDNQPHTRGDEAPRHPLAVIRRLSNADKHRTLLLASTLFSRGGQFGIARPVVGTWLRFEWVIGAFKPGAEVARFALTVDELRQAGFTSADDVKVQGYAAAGVAFNEPEMDRTREVLDVLKECVDFVNAFLTQLASRTGVF